MPFPLGFWDLSLWLTITAIILLVTSGLLSSYHGKINICINKKRLKNAALTISILCSIALAIMAIGTVFTP